VLQCAAVVLQCVAAADPGILNEAVGNIALQCVVVCCGGVAVCCSVFCSVLQCVAVCCSVLQQCVAVCCSVLQRVAACVAVCCSVLQRVLQ